MLVLQTTETSKPDPTEPAQPELLQRRYSSGEFSRFGGQPRFSCCSSTQHPGRSRFHLLCLKIVIGVGEFQYLKRNAEIFHCLSSLHIFLEADVNGKNLI